MEKFLDILNSDARVSLEDLAAMTDMTAQEAAAKIDEYKANGIIRGFSAVIDWERLEEQPVTALIELRITPMKNLGFDAIAAQVASFPEVESVYLMSGGFDLGVTVRTRSFRDVALFVSERIAPLDGVLSTATHFVLRRYKDAGFSFMDARKDERSEF